METEEKKKPSDEVLMQAHLKTQSRGERLFDWITYGGIAGLAVFIGSVPIAYYGKYGKGAWGRLYKWSAAKLERLGLSKSAAEDAVMVTSLMQGGNIAILPVKLMENKKAEIAGKLNEMLGDASDVEDIKKEPKQTWGSLIKARVFLAWTPVFLSFRGAAKLFPKSFESFEKEFAESVICKPLGKPTHTPGMPKVFEHETTAFRIGKIASLDLFATAAAATLLYVGSRIFAVVNGNGKNGKQEANGEASSTPPIANAGNNAIIEAEKPVINAVKPAASRYSDKAPAPASYTDKAMQRQSESPPVLSA